MLIDIRGGNRHPIHSMPASLSVAAALAAWVLVLLLVLVKAAEAHEARSVAGDPLGWHWPSGCCNSAATNPEGDCAIIDASHVVEGPDGYHVKLNVGDHPRLLTKGYSAVIPYGEERDSPSGEYGICLGTDGFHRYCFFAGSKGF